MEQLVRKFENGERSSKSLHHKNSAKRYEGVPRTDGRKSVVELLNSREIRASLLCVLPRA